MTDRKACRGAGSGHSLDWLLDFGVDMRRDDERLRELLLRIEDHDDWIFEHYLTSGSSDEHAKDYYHLRLLADAGLLEETGRHGGNFRMTSQGYDFLDTIKNDTNWNRVKAFARNVAGGGVAAMVQVATEIVRKQIEGGLGLL